MGQHSNIEWTDHTFNPWLGCTKVSSGCANCYAEAWNDKLWGKVKWGDPATGGTRMRTKKPWSEIVRWNLEAGKWGRRDRVFCASQADVFEDLPMLTPWRADLFELLEQCTHLDIQLLTKRPQNVLDMVPDRWLSQWPAHIWVGCTIEHRDLWCERYEHLTCIPAAVRFISAEPLLSDLRMLPELYDGFIHQVIAGGESGKGARPMHPDWARSLRDQCVAAGVPFFFKQWGDWLPYGQVSRHVRDPKANEGEWCEHRDDADRVAPYKRWLARRLGKQRAGRLLDGREWNQMPKTFQPRHARATRLAD